VAVRNAILFVLVSDSADRSSVVEAEILRPGCWLGQNCPTSAQYMDVTRLSRRRRRTVLK
jgi:hypothetical protein